MTLSPVRTVPLSEIADLPAHPVADLFPMYPADPAPGQDKLDISLSDLAESIEENGVRQPIVLFDGQILDGRNRRAAAKLTALSEVPVCDFLGTEEQAHDYILDLNIDRRNLDASRRAILAVEYAALCGLLAEWEAQGKANMSLGGQGFPPVGNLVRTRDALADRFRVGKAYMGEAVKLYKRATTGPDEKTLKGWAEHTSDVGHGEIVASPIEFDPAVDVWPAQQAAQASLAQIKQGKMSIKSLMTKPKAGPLATDGDKIKPEPKPETGVVTGADTAWDWETATYEQKRAAYVETLIRSAEHMASQITRFALTDGDIADAAEALSDESVEILATFFGSLR